MELVIIFMCISSLVRNQIIKQCFRFEWVPVTIDSRDGYAPFGPLQRVLKVGEGPRKIQEVLLSAE